MDADENKLVESIVRATVEETGFEVFRVIIREHRGLALVLDRDPEPVTLKDCVTMNRRIRRALEEAELDADDYSIEVESPGINRRLLSLRHFERFRNERIAGVLHEPRDGATNFKGTISSVSDERICIELENGKSLEVGLEDLKHARLDPELPF